MKLSACKENSLVKISSLPDELFDDALQHGLCPGECIRVLRNKPGVPLLLRIRGTKYGLRKAEASQILVEEVEK